MTLFVLSGLVAALSSVFDVGLVRPYVKEYEKRLTSLVSQTGVELPVGLSGPVIQSWLQRIADIAANFPAVVLTLVAFVDVSPFSSNPLATALLVLLAAVFVVALFWSDGPTSPPLWGIQVLLKGRNLVQLSLWTLILIALNVIGLCLTIIYPHLNGG